MEEKSKAKDSAISKETLTGLMSTIRNLYLADDIPWVIGYSGGKDSTATLQLVWYALKELSSNKRKKTVHIMHTNTLVESPVVSKWAYDSIKIMQEKAKEDGLPFETHILTPENDQTYWVNFIGRGYPFPRKKLRWCTDRLKIQPVNRFIQSKIAEHGEIILVIGTRKAESQNRARTMAKYKKLRVRELLSPNPSLTNELVFSPLEDWSDNDVWAFLMQYRNPWGYSNKDLLTLYRGATADNECPIMHEKNLPTCGKSRFGCWVCTMVEQDKSMAAMIMNDEEKAWMTPLLDFRNEFGDEDKDRERRSFRKMNGSIYGTYERLHHGPYLKEWREYYLRRLLEIQKDINENGPEEFRDLELITKVELREIRKIWVLEKHEFDDSLPRIYEEVTGEKYVDSQWIGSETFGAEEWKLLQEVCKAVAPDEELLFEMAYTLLDQENYSNGLNQRKGILNNLEKTIQHTFYKNEADATEYYSSTVNRKREYGGKFNEKFLEHIETSPDELDTDNEDE